MFRIRSMVALLFLCGMASLGAQAQMGDSGQQPAMALGAGRGVQGTVTAVAADHLTMKTEKGEVYQVAVSANTRVMKGREPMKLADVKVGDGVGAMGELDAPTKTVHALYLTVVDAEQLKKAREAMGKTWIAGTVTAINETKLTIMRTDQVSQVIEVDEDTSFRKGGRGMRMGFGANGGARGGQGRQGGQAPAAPDGDPVTLADVKVGSMVAGPGSLKNGIFVPATLGISEPGAQRQRRRQDGSAAAPANTPTPPTATPPTATPPTATPPTTMEPR